MIPVGVQFLFYPLLRLAESFEEVPVALTTQPLLVLGLVNATGS
jgi:hypothetical protein